MITDKAPRRPTPRLVKLVPPPVAEPDPLAGLRHGATVVRARRRQQLALAAGKAESVYIVRSGLLVLQTTAPGKHRQLLALHYPNDVFRAVLAPPLPGVALAAASPSEIWRLSASAFETLLATDPALGLHLNRQLADQHARTVHHVAAIGALNGEERVASFLMELGLRLGSRSAGGVSFEMPLSRTDIADYLALNPDTLSRIMSRLKARGLVVRTAHGHALLPDWDGLCGSSPVADTVISLHGRAAVS